VNFVYFVQILQSKHIIKKYVYRININVFVKCNNIYIKNVWQNITNINVYVNVYLMMIITNVYHINIYVYVICKI